MGETIAQLNFAKYCYVYEFEKHLQFFSTPILVDRIWGDDQLNGFQSGLAVSADLCQ